MTTTRPALLVIDDDVSLRTAFAKALDRAGFDVTVTTGSTAVLDLIEDCQPVAIVLDNHMPGASGIDLIKLIRHRWNAHDLPIVLISGSSVQAEINEAMQAGANDFRRKPVELPDLISTVRTTVDVSAALQYLESGVIR